VHKMIIPSARVLKQNETSRKCKRKRKPFLGNMMGAYLFDGLKTLLNMVNKVRKFVFGRK